MVKKNRWLLTIGLFLTMAFGWLYLVSAFRIPVNYADSDDLTMAAYFGGVAHPPGYTWLILLTQPWLSKLEPQQVALAANRFNSLVTAINLGLLFLNTYLVLPQANKRGHKHNLRIVAAFLTTLCFGLWQTTWLNARVFEIFPLAQFFILAGLGFCLFVPRVKEIKQFLLAGIAGLIWGIAIFFHLISVGFILPSLIYFYFIWRKGLKNYRKIWGRLVSLTIIVFILSFLTYQLIPITGVEYSWPFKQSLGFWWTFFWRLVYTPSGSAIETEVTNLNIYKSLLSILIWLKLWFFETWGVGLSLSLVGSYVVWKKNRLMFYWLGSGLVLTGLGLSAYLKFPLQSDSSAINYSWGTVLRWRMQYVAAIPIALFLSWGFWCLGDLIYKTPRLKRWAKGILILVTLTILTLGIWSNLAQLNLKPNLVQQHAQEVLSSLPLDSTLVVDSDLVFAFLYQQKMYHLRPDIQVMPLRFKLDDESLNFIKLPFDKLTPENEALEKIVTILYSMKSPIYLYAPSAPLLTFLGVEGNPFYAAPYGYTLAVGKTMPVVTMAYDYQSSQLAAQARDFNGFGWWLGFSDQLALIHAQMAYYWERLGYGDYALKHKTIFQRLTNAPKDILVVDEAILKGKDTYQAQATYANYQPLKAQNYIDRIKMDPNLTTEKIQYLISRAILLEPENPIYSKMLPGY